MIKLITGNAKLIGYASAFLALFVAGIAAGHYATDWWWSAKWAEAERDAQTAQTNQLNDVIRRHNTRVAELEKSDNAARTELAKALLAADNADRAGASLHDAISDNVRSTSRACDTATTIRERAAAATNILVLADVLRRADKAAGELAAVADQSRIRGLSCQESYESLAKSCN